MKENRNPSMSRSMGKGFPHVHRSIVVKISFFIAFAFVILLGLLTGYSIYSIQTASHNIREQQLRVMRVHTQQITTAAENATASLK